MTIPRVKMNSAWLITWEGTEPWARIGDGRSIMAIIDGRRSTKFVKEVLWLLDVRARHSGFMAYYTTRRREHGLPQRCGPGWRMEGANAWLYARSVRNLEVITKGGKETISWTEPDWIGNDPDTYQITVLDKGQPRVVSRSANECLGAEPYHRWNV